ncbi:ABC-three component system middle component 1 [Peribacillus sp. FSL E2-0159]|uniref:ABC-three component system middle component 1 n=1 Tax=Peribacillus sp. FSL E2-0159 TaxID=2975289 RepID=UPI00315AF3F2
MRNMIKQILVEKDFMIDESSLEDEISFLAERTQQNKFDFLTVMFLGVNTPNREVIKEKVEKYLMKIIETRQNFVGIEKNLTLLILLEVESLEVNKEISSLIYDFEEDPYDFKKYVMVYTKKQEALLESLLEASASEVNIITLVNQILNDSTKFSKFKSKEESEDSLIYDLVSKLFIKLPFLNMENNQQTLTSLYQEIVESFEVQDNNLWESFMELMEKPESEPSIEEILDCIGVGKIE